MAPSPDSLADNLRTAPGPDRAFDDDVLDCFRGWPSAEHGIGRIRGKVPPRVWGPEVYGVMQGIKDAPIRAAC